MNWKEFFKIDIKKVILTLIILGLIIIFFLPAKVNVLCKPGVPCPPKNTFIGVSETFTNPRFVSINYIYLVIELIFTYLISCSLIFIYKKYKK